MAHWGYEVDHTAVISMNDEQLRRSAKGAAQFLNSILGDAYRGDFMRVEKNGADAEWYVAEKSEDKSNPGNSRYWTDENNAHWVQWTKYLVQEVELPLLGWNICLGQEGLPNTNNQYEDTFFEYFFENLPAFIDAGWVYDQMLTLQELHLSEFVC